MAADQRAVVVVTAVDDITSDMVIAELNRRRSVPDVRFGPSEIGGDLTLSATFGSG